MALSTSELHQVIPSPIPQHVEQVIGALKEDAAVDEIWLFGSRVNGTANAMSDWDILVRAKTEPRVCPKRHSGIDVVWRGPSDSCLADGADTFFTFPFSDFQWKESGNEASYLGRKFIAVEYGVASDASEPLQVRTMQKAWCIWSRIIHS